MVNNLPNPSTHNPAPSYIKGLVLQACQKHAINQEWIARHWLGVDATTLRKWLTTGNTHRDCPYIAQWAIEVLIESDKKIVLENYKKHLTDRDNGATI